MKFLEIELTNWGPHPHRLITFDPRAKVIALTGENDKGKSWILKALAGVLVTGNNEYFDKSVIHDGETESKVRCVVETHPGQSHEIVRIFKSSAKENDEILLDQKPISPTDFNLWVQEQLQVQDPKIALSLAVSMQGETHFHLKSKRRDREESLRALTPLGKLDDWKNHLTKIINAEDKGVLGSSSQLEGRRLSLQESLTATTSRLQSLEEEIKGLTAGTLPDGTTWSLETQIEACGQRDQDLETLERLENELNNLESNLRLHEQGLARAKAQLAESPLKDQSEEEILAEETRLQNTVETLQETLARKKVKGLEVQLQESVDKIQRLQKEATEIKETLLSPEKAKEIQDALNLLQVQEEVLRPLLVLLKGTPSQEELLEKKTLLEVRLNNARKAAQAAVVLQTNTNQALKTLRAKCDKAKVEGANPLSNQEQLTALKEILLSARHKCLENLRSNDITSTEANLLKQRILKNWKTGANPCPISGTELGLVDDFASPAAREESLRQLETLLAQEGGTWAGPQQEDLQRLVLLESILQSDLPHAQNLLEEQSTSETPQVSPEALEKQIQEVDESLRLIAQKEGCVKTIEGLNTQLQELVGTTEEGTSPKEAAQAILKDQTDKTARLGTLQSLETQEKIHQGGIQASLEEAKVNLPETPSPACRMLLDEDATVLQSELQKTSATLKTLRENRTKLKPILDEIKSLTLKVNTTKASLEESRKKQGKLKGKTHQSYGIIHPEGPEDLAKISEAPGIWKRRATRCEEIRTLQTELTPQKGKLETQIAEATAELEKTKQEALKLEAAKKLADFLDYKDAPRRLLSLTVDKIFSLANRMAHSFQLGMVLTQGKNLDFLVTQTRGSKTIIQKTERLGFGKAAILGICTRLAAQRLLSPQTGFLLLDEPSPHVDTARKLALKEFLEKLGESQEMFPQIIMVEHEDLIAQAANQIICIN
jgi:DNA repair exonuclease SbcCD ATPase subunit